jgi:hypothetical protein
MYCVAQTLTGLKSTTGKDRFSSVYFRPQNFVGALAEQAVSAVSRLLFDPVAVGRAGGPVSCKLFGTVGGEEIK